MLHSLVYHVPEFIKAHGNISKFTQQGLEKLNDLHFWRSTNHRDEQALKQVMEKRNRLEELEDAGYKRKAVYLV